jgi:PPP family 3-phenylpropionic acid transporter
LLIITVAAAFFFKPIIPLTDSAALESVKYENQYSYGKIRVWGTIGFLFSNLVLSKIIEFKGLESIFVITAILMLISLILPILMKKNEIKIETTHLKISELKIFLSLGFILIFIANVLVEIGNTAIYGFYTLYLSSLDLSKYIGIAWGIGVIIEIPVYLFSKNIINKVGIKKIILLGLLAHIIKFIGISLIKEPKFFKWIFLIQIAHGIFFGSYYAGLVNLIDIKTPVFLKNSGQSIFITATYGVGAILGFYINGLITDKYDFSVMFIGNAVLLIIAGILFKYVNIKKYENLSEESL